MRITPAFGAVATLFIYQFATVRAEHIGHGLSPDPVRGVEAEAVDPGEFVCVEEVAVEEELQASMKRQVYEQVSFLGQHGIPLSPLERRGIRGIRWLFVWSLRACRWR